MDPQQLHVFVEDKINEAGNMSGPSKRTYLLIPDNRIVGEAHYYIGLMYNNSYCMDQDEENTQNYFKAAYSYDVERAKKLLFHK
jgi:hypothetical protein